MPCWLLSFPGALGPRYPIRRYSAITEFRAMVDVFASRGPSAISYGKRDRVSIFSGGCRSCGRTMANRDKDPPRPGRSQGMGPVTAFGNRDSSQSNPRRQVTANVSVRRQRPQRTVRVS